MRKLLLAAATVTLLSGCNTISSVDPERGVGFEVQDRTYTQVWNAAVETVSSQLTIVESSRERGLIKAEKGVGLTTWGEVVGVSISPQTEEAGRYRVSVQSQKRSALQITGQNWTNTIIEGIKARLGL